MQPDFHQAQHIGRREEQQDALGNLVLAPRHTLYVLADGMGGQQGGQTAARAVVAAILDHFHRQNPPADSRAAENQLHAALNAANQALARILQSHPELDGMGSTLIALIADENTGTYSYISVGDSPLYLLENGRLRRINANHAFAEDLKRMIAAGEITAEEAERHPARHAVTSAVTGKDIAHTDCRSGSLNPGDTLLLASDGVQTLSDREIEDTLNAAADPEAQAQALISVVLAKQNPHQDNTSLILVRHPADPSAPATQTLPTQAAPADRQPENGEQRPPAKSSLKGVFVGFLLGALLIGGLVYHLTRPTEETVPPPAASEPAAQSASEAAASVPSAPPPAAASETPASEPAPQSASEPPAAAKQEKGGKSKTPPLPHISKPLR
ncbi:protein phosphatase 2C domain-containing protein [Kingella sp. SNUBH-2017]|uniref:PP2C family protein-serine/threonine phosphatase n=1 Tax=Kingella sp. SNUBH-2017 TaxID=2994077 RepID=UPI002363DB88|nr:protein phosphatase 2C domain-containing protein [Kingella sp. SNUBH-2017]MDD2182526.1 protein phosphatase 2C domain-containing protein [Kingella sp. SNUBH-2017]